MGEDLDNHRRIFDGGPSMAGDDLQAAAAVRAVFDVDVEDPFEQIQATNGNEQKSGHNNHCKNAARLGQPTNVSGGMGRQRLHLSAQDEEPFEQSEIVRHRLG